MKKAIVVNCSLRENGRPHYNLGAHKLSDWLTTQEYSVTCYDGDPGMWELDADLVCLSVIFSWHAPVAREIALRMKANADVWCGGPGMFALKKWWNDQTGLEIVKGLDSRFDTQQGNYKMTFASRGCPVNCSFCIVPRLEGIEFSFFPDFQPAPILCDNNLSALPVEYQEHIIKRYQDTGVRLLDANSGFEPRYFDEGTYKRWKPILHGPWRFAFDEMREHDDVKRMMDILRNESKSKKRVYVLIGNEPVESCYERAMKVIEWGGEPYCQYVLPLNWLGDTTKIRPRYNWTYQLGRDFMRYFNTYGWRSYPLSEYEPRKHQVLPFAEIAL